MLIPLHTSRLRHRLLPVFALSVIFSFLAIAQEPDMNRLVSVNYSDVPLELVLKNMSQTYNIQFSYNPKKIPVDFPVSYQAVNKSLGQVINEVFQLSGIQYSVVDGYLVLKEKKTEKPEVKPPKPELYTISGVVSDSASNEVLIGAAVYIKETGLGTVTNNYGFFSLTLPKGDYTLEISFIGFSLENRKVNLTGPFKWNVNLKSLSSILEEIVITPVNKEEMVFNARAAQSNMEPKLVQKQAAAMGETDMLKSMDNIPGISFQGDGSSYFSVRGGNRDQNLILLDETPIFNPSHLLGLFTPIIPEAVKHTEVYKADFPIQYGGRLSSVIDIRTRDGNMQKFSGYASTGLVSTRFSLEGPFKKKTSSYFISYRRSQFGMFLKKANPKIQDFYFADFTSKFNFKLGAKDRLYLTLFTGKDVYLNKPAAYRNGLKWGNKSMTMRWNHVFHDQLFLNTTFYTSKYDYSLYTNYDRDIYWNSHISSTGLKSECTHYYNPGNKIKFGMNFGGYFFNPGNYNSPDTTDNMLRVSRVNSSEVVFYVGNEHEITRWLILNYGVRYSRWSDLGEGFSIQYDSDYNPVAFQAYKKGERYYSKRFLEPRVSVSVKTGRYAALKASYNRTIQHINLINNSISPFNTLEVWLPSGPNIKPQYARIADLGYVISWPDKSVDISADVYYKKMYNQIGYSPHAEMFLNPLLEGELRQGDGYAYGFELIVRKTLGKLSGQIGYGFNKSYLKIEGLNNNRKFLSHQDKPVDFSLLVDYTVNPRWTLTANLLYSSGMPISTPTSFFYYRGTQVPVYTEQNNERLPDYRRLDLSIVYRLNKPENAFEHYLTLTLFNFFATKNYAFLYFNKTVGEDGNFYVPADKLNTDEQVASYRYVYSMIPTLTYNLKF